MIANWMSFRKTNLNGKQWRYWGDISPVSTLFTMTYVSVCRVERVISSKDFFLVFKFIDIFFSIFYGNIDCGTQITLPSSFKNEYPKHNFLLRNEKNKIYWDTSLIQSYEIRYCIYD